MAKRIFSMIIPAAALIFTGCADFDIGGGLNSITIRGSGKMISEQRTVRGFNEVELTGTGELTIQQGDTESLTIEAEDNILPKIRTGVEGGRLSIGVERGISIRPTVAIRYRLVLRDLTELELSGSGTISSGPLRCRELTVDLPGSGKIRFDQLNAENLRAGISGSGSIQIPGRVTHQDVRISGSGDYDAKDLESRSAEVSISGSGESTLWVHERLSAHISGSGSIEYYGNPTVDKSISGSGGIHNRGQRP